MRFWVFTGKAAAGPYEPGRLKALPGFGPGTVVAPEGAATEEAWKPARDFPELRPLSRDRMLWILAATAVLLLLASVLYSAFERLGSGRSAAAAPSSAGPQRPMPFEAPGSPLLKTK